VNKNNMAAIYAKFNRERLPKFQTATIINNDNNTIKVEKHALNVQANNHIYSIESNYKLLVKSYPNMNFAKCLLKDNKIIMDYIEGNSFESILLKAVFNKNKNTFYDLLNEYKKFLFSFSANKDYPESIYKNKAFINIFGNTQLNDLEYMEIANLDVTFDNLIIDKDKRFNIIDYEWVFNFPIPILFIAYRAAITFYSKNGNYLKDFISRDELISYFVNSTLKNKFEILQFNFLKYVYGLNNYSLENYKKEVFLFNNDKLYNNSKMFESKLYIDIGEGFKEETSILAKADVYKKHLSVKFNLISYNNEFYSFRWDPIENNLCKVKIKSISFQLLNGKYERYDLKHVTNNGITDKEEWVIFYTFDPMFFIPIKKQIKLLHIEADWDFIPNYELEKRFLGIIKVLNKKIEGKNQEIKEKVIEIEAKNQEIKEKDIKIEGKNQEIKEKNKELKEKNLKIENTLQEIKLKNLEILSLSKKIEIKNQEIGDKTQQIKKLLNSKSWKITAPLRKLYLIVIKLKLKKGF